MAWIFSASSPDRNPKRFSARQIRTISALTFLPILFSLNLIAQQLLWSAPERNDRALERVRVAEQADSIFHVIEEREDHKLRWLQYHTQSLRVISATEIAPQSEEHVLAFFFIINDTLHTLTTRRNRESDNLEILALRYNSQGQKIDGEKIVHSSEESNAPRNSGLACKVSPDGKRLLLYFDKDSERKQTEGIDFKCYDTNWQLQWEKELRLPPAPEILQVHHFLLDNYGGVYMMSGRNPVKTNSDWQRPQGGQYVVYYYNAILNKLKQYDINLKDKQVISAGFLLNDQQEVIIAGFYSNNFQNIVSGTLLFSLKAQGGAISLAGYTPFNKEFIKEALGRENNSFEDFYLDHIHLTPQGKVVLVGEQYYVSRSVSTDPTTGRQLVEYRYNYDDVLACMMDTTAEHLWNIYVPKRQMSSMMNDPNFSYSFSADSSGIALTFNDNSDNNEVVDKKNRSQAEMWNGGKNSVTTRVDIGYDGSYSRKTLLDNSNERLLFNPLMTPSGYLWQRLLGFDDKRTYKFCLLP